MIFKLKPEAWDFIEKVGITTFVYLGTVCDKEYAGDKADLHQYALKDGRKCTEFIQYTPWNTHDIFIALMDEDGEVIEESIWHDYDEIQKDFI